VAWAICPVLMDGSVAPGTQSLPAYRLPLVINAEKKFTFGGAMLDVVLQKFTGGRRCPRLACVVGGCPSQAAGTGRLLLPR
jgi:hypothetical protein